MTKLLHATFAVTTEPVPRNGRYQITEDMLPQLLEKYTSKDRRWLREHDERRPWNLDIVHAEIRETDRGYKGVWVVVEHDEDVDGPLPGGLSVGVRFPRPGAWGNPGNPPLAMEIDAQVGDERIDQIVATLSEHLLVTTRVLVELALEPKRKLVLTAALPALLSIPAGILSGAILHAMFAPPGPVTVVIKAYPGATVAYVDTKDPLVVRAAVDKLDALPQSGGVFEFDASRRSWREVSAVTPVPDIPSSPTPTAAPTPEPAPSDVTRPSAAATVIPEQTSD